MNKGIFVTGTDTGIGKTYVSVRIAEELRRCGVDVGVMKPAETGCLKRSGRLIPSDAVRLMRAAGVRDSLAHVNPYRFTRPLAPSLAAELEGKQIDTVRILRSFQALSQKHEFMIVEGAGGIMVPLAHRYCYVDLAADLDLPVIIVAHPGLGTINHTLLTISALRGKGVAIAGVVINFANDRKAGLAEKTSPGIIEKISGIGILGTVRHGSDCVQDIVEKMQSPCNNRGDRDNY